MAEPTVQFMVSVICVLNVRAMISSGAPKLHLNFKHKGEGRVYNFFEQRPPNIKTHLRTAVRTVSKKIPTHFYCSFEIRLSDVAFRRLLKQTAFGRQTRRATYLYSCEKRRRVQISARA